MVTTTTLFCCPVCEEPLAPAEHAYRCMNGHLFDIAREGYINLLLPQHRHSKDPGYSKEMIAARRDFFDAGHYEPLADGIAELIGNYLPTLSQDRVVIDAGCGEGYYLRRLRAWLASDHASTNITLCGLDISKHGVRVAARRDPQGHYAVASTHRMPIVPHTADVLLTHFSPVSAEDFRRVVKPGGIVLVGGPGKDHLFSFRKLLYDTPVDQEPTDALAGEPGFDLVDTHSIRYPLSLQGPGQLGNLLVMTPFFWSVNQATRDRIAGVAALDTEVDVVIYAYRRSS